MFELSSRPGWVACLWLSGILCGLIASDVSAQSAKTLWSPEDAWLRNNWSWVFWWEANADTVLADRDTSATLPAVDRLRETLEAIATDVSEENALRIEAVVGLGRLGGSGTLPVLEQLTSDRSLRVREAAWVAVGLNRSEDARQLLSDQIANRVSAGTLIAAGLIQPQGEAERLEWARKITGWVRETGDQEATALSIWALRQLVPDQAAELAPGWARRARSVDVAVEAILTVRPLPEKDHAELLVQTYYDLHHDQSRLPILQEIYNDYRPRPRVLVPSEGLPARAVRAAAAKALTRGTWTAADPDKQREADRIRSYVYESLKKPYEKIRDQSDNVVMWRPDKRGLNWNLETGGHENRWALLAIAQLAEGAESEILIDALRGGLNPRFFDHREAHPGRAFGAIALGHYLQAVNRDPQRAGSADEQAHERRSLRELARVVGDRSEHENRRAAALLGLGIAGSPAAAKTLRKTLADTQLDSAFTQGFAVLALAMTGERKAAVALAKSAMVDATTVPDVRAIRMRYGSVDLTVGEALGVRAMCYGLGLVGGSEAAAILRQVIGSDLYTTQAAAQGLRMCGDGSLVETLCDLLEIDSLDGPGAGLRRLAVLALAEMGDADGSNSLRRRFVGDGIVSWPSRLGGDLQEWLREKPVFHFKVMAHPFLYELLIPARETSRG
ncbi:MAG: HEAT repeat domain-containing protein [Planctomycetota bacterium]